MTLLEVVFSILLCAAVSSCHTRHCFRWEDVDQVLSFGDSYSYVLGTMGSPLLPAFFTDATRLAFTAEQLFANEIIPNRTSSDGKNWLEYLTGCFEGLPSRCDTQLWPFAHGGATIHSALIPPRRNTTVQVDEQVRQWRDYASPYLPRPGKMTLTTWWTGINDCTRIYSNATITDPEAYIEADLDAYFRLIDSVAHDGLQTHLLLNVPPINASPYALTFPAGPEVLKKAISIFNNKLVNHVAEYAKAHPEQHIMIFDAASVFNRIIDHPHWYGFSDVTTFCTNCTNKRDFLWHNDEHPTDGVHRILAREIKRFLSEQCS